MADDARREAFKRKDGSFPVRDTVRESAFFAGWDAAVDREMETWRRVTVLANGYQPHIFPDSVDCIAFVARIHAAGFNDGRAIRGHGATPLAALLSLLAKLEGGDDG